MYEEEGKNRFLQGFVAKAFGETRRIERNIGREISIARLIM